VEFQVQAGGTGLKQSQRKIKTRDVQDRREIDLQGSKNIWKREIRGVVVIIGKIRAWDHYPDQNNNDTNQKDLNDVLFFHEHATTIYKFLLPRYKWTMLAQAILICKI